MKGVHRIPSNSCRNVFAVHFILMTTLNQGNSRWEMLLCFNSHCDARELHWPFLAAILSSLQQTLAVFRLVLDFYCPFRSRAEHSIMVPTERWHNWWPDACTQHRQRMGGLGQICPQGWQRLKAHRKERTWIQIHTPACQCTGCFGISASLLTWASQRGVRLNSRGCKRTRASRGTLLPV